MNPDVCTYGSCKQGLLDKTDKTDKTLTVLERRHLRAYHSRTTCDIFLQGVDFRLRIDRSQGDKYICNCGKQLASHASITSHVKGKTGDDACPNMLAIARDILASGKALHDDKDDEEILFNAWPSSINVPAQASNQDILKSIDGEILKTINEAMEALARAKSALQAKVSQEH